ncbi:uncharacterized protein DMAD_13213 [Drosophila madeirensis]|uniref:Uncharacterized protein n=1 Tax=Drosophila madeirensis TaxID=30013 RepID=A0AAU9FJH4_DROMD
MPAYCAVVNCNDKYAHASSISFHKFPFKRKDLFQKWKEFTLRSAQWMPSRWSAVCSRHFVDTDFSCSHNRKTLKKNAVPSVRLPDSESLNVVVEQVTNSRWQESASKQTLSSAAEAPASGTKGTCRFCGSSAMDCVSFDNSFELFGMIQKCFPTLQILQDDTLPKDICSECYKHLERFSQFIDVVLQTQSELQRKYRRQLKIKQEPLVRVKQEACESLDNLFPDELDMALDDGCDHEPGTNDETEQKFQFCDFPMLNAQDIINNCDIMEIINLDDPFINIPDDADVGQSQAKQSRNSGPLPSANEMLQSELLNEEHNYAKEDWVLPPHQYKTEKVEGVEAAEQPPPLLLPPPPTHTSAPEPRSCKPIVTNVSQIPNQMLCELLPPPPAAPPKPNIVVLNDSVVQSSAAFRLHNCSLCTAKFITVDGLSQHYTHAHSTPTPMVSVPPLNISMPSMPTNQLKMEANGCSVGLTATPQNEYWQPNWQNAAAAASPLPTQLPAKKKIDILDMQRSFLHHTDLIPTAAQLTAAAAAAAPVAVHHAADPQLAVVTANLAKLAFQYRRLQRKCRILKHSTQRNPNRHRCSQCGRGFASLQRLLRHRQLKRHFAKLNRPFSARCCGCLKLFSSRLGLRQHMRYICQSLSLRSTRRLQSFKCRHCQAITFTHWRLYRRHELKCRPRQSPSKAKVHTKPRRVVVVQSQTQTATMTSTTYACSVCKKAFGSLSGLRQHDITHTTERQHKCGICERVFKRRNGLSQHIKGYHLQLKPHECPVCRHCYALKCDMLRCRHSQHRGGAGE